ncbi:MAG TPA: hypothetical protein VK017_07505 [Sphingobacterium sp.]|nr:hypothetical protein [Sphingobacterium sp.]
MTTLLSEQNLTTAEQPGFALPRRRHWFTSQLPSAAISILGYKDGDINMWLTHSRPR